MRTLNGGWSYTWQGSSDEEYVGGFNTIFEALSERFDRVRYVPSVIYPEGGKWDEDENVGIFAAVAAAYRSDVVIACIGENTYCETPGNLNDLRLSDNQRELVAALASTGRPLVLVLNEGRPRVISDIEPLASAVVDVMLPGNYGADALSMLLRGDENFSGKLPFTYPKYVNSLHTYDYKVSEHREIMDGAYNYDAVMDVQWPFGAGLSYTTYEYSDLEVSPANFSVNDTIKVSVTVKNTGQKDGSESVLVYSSDLVASMIPNVKRLRAFTKVSLKAGESGTVELSIPAKELSFAGDDGKWHLERGDFRISAGGLGKVIYCEQTSVW